MPRGNKRLTLDNFLGGYNVRDDPVDMALNEAQATMDIVPYGEGGSIVQRDADLLLRSLDVDSTPPAAAVRPLQRVWFRPAGYVIAYTGSGKVVAVTADGALQFVLYDPGGAMVPFAGAADAWFMEAPVSGGQGPLYMRARTAAAANTLLQSTGTGAAAAWTASAGTLPVKAWYLYVGNRVWALGNPPVGAWTPAEASSVYWSDLGNPRDWPAANVVQLAPADGEDFTGAGSTGEVLIVFKSSKAWVIYDLDTGANRPLGEDVGSVSMNTVCTTPVGLFFIDPGRGPMLTDGTSTKPLENGTKAPWTEFASVAYADDRIYCASNSGFRYVWEYNIRTRSWWRQSCGSMHLTAAPATGAVYSARYISGSDQAGLNQLFVPGQTSGLSPSWRSVPFALGAPENKRLHRLGLRGDGTAIVSIWRDIGVSAAILDVETLTNTVAEWPTLGMARMPSFTISRSGGSSFRLDQLVLDYSVRQR